MIGSFKIVLIALVLLSSAVAGSNVGDDIFLLSDGGLIRGIVVDEQNQPLEHATVRFYSGSFMPVDSVISLTNGTFSKYLENGDYFISAETVNYSRKYFPDAYLTGAARSINLQPSQVEDIIFRLELGGSICGEISTGYDQPSDFLMSAVKIDYPYEGWQYDRYFRIINHGSYCLDGLIPGYYKIFARSEGYRTVFYPQVLTFDEAEIIEVNVGDIADNRDFILEKVGSGTINGTVFDIGGFNPVEGARISAYQWSNSGEDPNEVTVYTDANGYFELEVTGGYYSVRATIELGFELGNYVDIYYDSYYDPRLASIVQVIPEETISGVDFEVDFSLHYNLSISGNINDSETGYPLEGARLSALEYRTGRPLAISESDYNGGFEIENLHGGVYVIEVEGAGIIPSFWPNKFNWQEAETIVLTSTNRELYDGGAITQDYGTPGFSISGIVTGPFGPLADVRIYATNTNNGNVAFARSKASGEYSISSGLFEGNYTLFADLYGWQGSYYAGAIYLDIIENPSLENIDFELSPITVNVNEPAILPEHTGLIGNYPNPFNSSTTILYLISNSLQSELEIYDIAGRLVRKIPITAAPGLNSVYWDGHTSGGANVSSGIYFYRLRELAETKKMILLK